MGGTGEDDPDNSDLGVGSWVLKVSMLFGEETLVRLVGLNRWVAARMILEYSIGSEPSSSQLITVIKQMETSLQQISCQNLLNLLDQL